MGVSYMALLVFLILCLWFGSAGAEKINVAYGAVSGSNSPLWVTYEGGFFKKNGLDVHLIFIQSSTTVTQSLIAGEVRVAQSGMGPPISVTVNSTEKFFSLAGSSNRIPFVFMVSERLKSTQDFLHKRFGVSRFGASSDFILCVALKQLNLNPDKDVAILQIGNSLARLTALQAGAIDGSVFEAPAIYLAKKEGFRVVARLDQTNLPYFHSGLIATEKFVREHPDTVARVVKSYIEGIHFYKTRKEESIRILQKYLKVSDREALEEAYQTFAVDILERAPYPSEPGIQTIINTLAEKEPRAKGLKAKDFIEDSFIRSLDKSGFIRSLYSSY